MAADAADDLVADAFDVDLAERVDLDGGVDGDERLAAREPRRVVRVGDAAQDVLTVGPVVEGVAAEQITG